MRRVLIVVVAGTLVLAACASDGGDASEDEIPMQDDGPVASEQTQSSDEPIPVEPNNGIGDGTSGEDLPVVSPDLASEVEQAVDDLRSRLDDDGLIEVVAAFELTWPNGALGCPDEGTAYTDALVDGYVIELSDGETTYAYHGALGDAPFLCETPIRAGESLTEAPVEGTESLEREGASTDGSVPDGPVGAAVLDLAATLDVSTDAVTVVKVEDVTWRSSALGCPQPDMSYLQQLVQGSRIQLSVDGTTYWYHRGESGAPFLCATPEDPYTGTGDA